MALTFAKFRQTCCFKYPSHFQIYTFTYSQITPTPVGISTLATCVLTGVQSLFTTVVQSIQQVATSIPAVIAKVTSGLTEITG